MDQQVEGSLIAVWTRVAQPSRARLTCHGPCSPGKFSNLDLRAEKIQGLEEYRKGTPNALSFGLQNTRGKLYH